MTEVNPQEYDFSTDLAIDPEALDVEWLQQPSLYVKYSTLASRARQEMEEAKDKIDLIKAEIDKEIRDNPAKFTGEDKKPTEAQITSLIIQDKRFKEVNEEYNELRLNFNILMGIVTGMDHKKSALENLVKLNGQSYFSAPSIPRNLGKEWEAKQKQDIVRQKTKEAMGMSDEQKSQRRRRA